MGAAMGAVMVEAGIAVKALLQGATPERKQEIEDLWDRYAPKVCVAEDARGVNISAGKSRIQFDYKAFEAIWLLGFNGWNVPTRRTLPVGVHQEIHDGVAVRFKSRTQAVAHGEPHKLLEEIAIMPCVMTRWY